MNGEPENLKKGKTILVKEFSKKKNFMSLRGLYESDARHWLILLKPILMMHPQRISTYFPPEPGLFDIAIILGIIDYIYIFGLIELFQILPRYLY